jgi:hypothetical protein
LKNILVLIFLLPVLLVGVWIIIRNRKKATALMFLLALLTFGIFAGQKAQAATRGDDEDILVSRTDETRPNPGEKKRILEGVLSDMAYKWRDQSGDSYWSVAGAIDSSVAYSAKSSIAESINMNNPESLPIGIQFTVSDTTHTNGEAIYWFMTGDANDSPYGHFSSDLNSASWPARDSLVENHPDWRIYGNIDKPKIYNKELWAKVVAQVPEIEFVATGPVVEIGQSEYGRTYQVTAPGKISVKAIYQRTQAKVFYKQITIGDDGTKMVDGAMQKKINCVDERPEGCVIPSAVHSTELTEKIGECSKAKYVKGAYADDASISYGFVGGCYDATYNDYIGNYRADCTACNSDQASIGIAPVTFEWNYTAKDEPVPANSETVKIILTGLDTPFSGAGGSFDVMLPTNPPVTKSFPTTYVYDEVTGNSVSTNVGDYVAPPPGQPERTTEIGIVTVQAPSVNGISPTSINFENCDPAVINDPTFGRLSDGGEICRVVVNYETSVASTLKLCYSSCTNGTSVPNSLTMQVGEAKFLKACYGVSPTCGNAQDVTSSTAWTESNSPQNAVSLSGTDPKKMTATTVGAESISASYLGSSDGFTVAVSAPCTCDPSLADNYCEGTDYDNSCGNPVCPGSKPCPSGGNKGWREVAPSE